MAAAYFSRACTPDPITPAPRVFSAVVSAAYFEFDDACFQDLFLAEPL